MRINQYKFRGIAHIIVDGFSCAPQHVASLTGMLSKHLIAMVTDEFPKTDLALKRLDEYPIQYFSHSHRRRDVLLALIPFENRDAIVQIVREWDMGSVLLFNLKNDLHWQVCCQDVLKLTPKYLIANDMSTMAMIIDFDEYTCEILADLRSYRADEVIGYIKAVSTTV